MEISYPELDPEKQVIPYERLHSIGDKILVDAEFDELGYNTDRYIRGI